MGVEGVKCNCNDNLYYKSKEQQEVKAGEGQEIQIGDCLASYPNHSLSKVGILIYEEYEQTPANETENKGQEKVCPHCGHKEPEIDEDADIEEAIKSLRGGDAEDLLKQLREITDAPSEIFDYDQDGKLSPQEEKFKHKYLEFGITCGINEKGAIASPVLVDAFDENENGMLEPEEQNELGSYLQYHQEIDKRVNQKFDKDGDGKLNAQEFGNKIKFLNSELEKDFDINKDQKLDDSEYNLFLMYVRSLFLKKDKGLFKNSANTIPEDKADIKLYGNDKRVV